MTSKSSTRILLKLSGEILMGNQPFGIHQEACQQVADSIKELASHNVQIGIVIGGGNIFRGIQLQQDGVARTPADQMGMVATILNGMALQQALSSIGCDAVIMSALDCPKVAESYTWKSCIEHLSRNQIVIFTGGTGNPYFTTDTAAALRASEINASVLLKATKVNGVYDKDPQKFKDAIKYPTIDYSRVLAEKLGVMDATAIAMCRSNHVPVFVFNMQYLLKKQIKEILTFDNAFGTLIQGE